jgi:hypothetical protein
VQVNAVETDFNPPPSGLYQVKGKSMFNGFKATIRKWAGLPLQDVTNLLTWSDGKDVEFGNRNLLIASAAKDGQTVAYLVAEPTLIIINHVFDPHTTPSDAQRIGDSLDAALAEKAKEMGADRFLIVVPNDTPHQQGEHVLRVISRKISTNEKRFSVDPRTNSVKFIN